MDAVVTLHDGRIEMSMTGFCVHTLKDVLLEAFFYSN